VLGQQGRPRRSQCTAIFDSRKGFKSTLGGVVSFFRVLMVHSPSSFLSDSRKALGVVDRLYTVPTKEELMGDVDLICQSSDATLNLTKEQVEERIFLYGPIMRHVFAVNPEVDINSGIQKLVGAGIDCIMDVQHADRLSHTLMINKGDHEMDKYMFASLHIAYRVCDHLAQSCEMSLLQFVNVIDITGHLRWQLFECRMYYYLSQATVTFQTKTQKNEKQKKLKLSTGEQFATKNIPNIPAVNRVYRPISKTNESWDAVLLTKENDR